MDIQQLPDAVEILIVCFAAAAAPIVSNVAASLSAVLERLREGAETHKATVSVRAAILGRPAPAGDAVKEMRRIVDSIHRAWVQERGPAIAATCGGKVQIDEASGKLQIQPGRLPQFLGQLRFEDLIGIAPELVKASLESAIRLHGYPVGREAGSSLKDRQTELDEIDAEIRKIEEEHTALVDAAAALDPPITLPLLDCVRQRRETAARKAQRDAETIEARRRAEERLNAAQRNQR